MNPECLEGKVSVVGMRCVCGRGITQTTELLQISNFSY